MKHAIAIIIFITVGFGVPLWCFAGQSDALPGMATHGIVRLPYSGMVDQTFGTTRRPKSRSYRKPDVTSPRIDAQSKEGEADLEKFENLEVPLDSRSSESLSESNINP